MSVVLQINYTPDPAMPKWSAQRARDVALQIAAIPVLHWELLVQCETEGTWGGIYLFETEASARAWEVDARSLLARIGATSVLTQLLLVLADEAQGEPTPVERAAKRGQGRRGAGRVRSPDSAPHGLVGSR
jgi:hypothetical protein